MGLKDTLDAANRTIMEQQAALSRAERAEKRMREEIRSAVANSEGRVEEALASVQAMFAQEDMGWSLFTNYLGGEEEGLELEDLKHWSFEIRQAVIGNAHIGRGYRFRRNFIWRDNIRYNNPPAGGRGGASKLNIKSFIDDPYNQRQFFSTEARAMRELACFADGLYVALGNQKTKRIRSLPLKNITGLLRDPDNADEVWAYRHSWVRRNADGTPGGFLSEWVFVDMYKDKETPTVNALGVVEPVNRDLTAFDLHPNRAHGWALGAPDGVAALMWSRIVRDLMMDGVAMTAAMAKLFAQVTVPNKQAGQNAAAAIAQITDAGATAVSGSAVTPLASAGKGYEFNTFRPVVAIMAAAMDVPIAALTSDTAGSGMGSALASLDEPTQYAMEERRDFHLPLDIRVLQWAGWQEPNARFLPLIPAADKYRISQGINADFQTGLWSPQQIKQRQLALDGYDITVDLTTIPNGVMLPNNEQYVNTLSNDDQSALGAATDSGVPQANPNPKAAAKPAAAASGQGKSNDPSVGKMKQDQSTRIDRQQ